MNPVSWTNHIERERTHSLIYSLVCGNERNVQNRKSKALSLSTAWHGFLCYQYMVISKINRKLSIHYSASSECFYHTLEASPLYSLNNHPSSSTHSCNSKSHAKYGEETFQSKQAHRICTFDTFSQQMESPSSLHLNCLYIHCVQNVDLWNSNPVLILLWEASLLNLSMYAVMGDARQTLKLIGSTILHLIFSVVWRCNATL